jgi:hypothetical protein
MSVPLPKKLKLQPVMEAPAMSNCGGTPKILAEKPIGIGMKPVLRLSQFVECPLSSSDSLPKRLSATPAKYTST